MNKKGFTLVELLAVIAILALLIIIALPNVLSMFNSAKKDIFLTQAKNVYKEVSKKYISETMKGNKITKISSKDNKLDIESNDMEYNIILDDKGNVKKFQVSDGTYCLSGNFSNLNEFTTDKITDGKCEESNEDVPVVEGACTFNGELVQGAEYVNGVYTYKYMMEGTYSSSELAWQKFTTDGWGVQLTDKTSTDSVASKPCLYINNKPVVSMRYMFANSQATIIDVSDFNTSNIINMSSMFSNSKTTTIDLSNFDTSNVTDMSSMFASSKSTTLNFKNFDTSNVTNMKYMFSYCQTKNLDLSSFDTSKVTDMSGMFHCNKATSLNFSNFDTSNVTDMSDMFELVEVKTLDVSNFNTSKVTKMSSMFEHFSGKVLDLSSFDTSNVTNMYRMFEVATNLKTIYASDKFVTNKVTNSNEMFLYCGVLVGGSGTKYNSSKSNSTYARIDGGTSSPGYFTKKIDIIRIGLTNVKLFFI